MSIQTQIRKVSPVWAKGILDEHNKRVEKGEFRQRRVNERLVMRYANDMKSGNWTINGESISFDEKGNLINGQHRLWAVVSANVEVMLMITTGLPEMGGESSSIKTMDTVDIGRSRNFGMQLRIDGSMYATQMAAMVRCCAILTKTNVRTIQLSPAQCWEILDLIKDNGIKVVQNLTRDNQLKNARGYLIAPITLLRSVRPDEIDMFCEELNTMVQLSRTSPVLALKRFMDRPTTQLSNVMVKNMAAVITALHAYCQNRKLENVRGSDESMIWFENETKNILKKISTIVGQQVLNVEELRSI